MRTVDHRDVLLIAGDDPYEFKGIEDPMLPHVRPDGEGGCSAEQRKLRRRA